MDFIRKKIAHILSQNFELDFLETEKSLEIPKEESFGDLAFPCFLTAKKLKKNPALIAREWSETLRKIIPDITDNIIEDVTAAGAFLNIHLNFQAVLREVFNQIENGAWFNPQNLGQFLPDRIMVEFSQPNTHKIFHVGHLRNVVVGDALVRILRYAGKDVVSANFIGDAGTHIALCLWYFLNHRSEEPPEAGKAFWLGELYTKARILLENADETTREKYDGEISIVLKSLEQNEPGIIALWKKTRQWSIDNFWEIYFWLGVSFDTVFYESEVTDSGKQMVSEYLDRSVFQISHGAVIVDLEKYSLGIYLVLKSDGTSLYSTKDLALAKLKFDKFNIQASWYVVGSEQNLYFRQLFKTLELMGYKEAWQCRHISYELVVLPDGKMSSRKGNIISFENLRDEIVQRIMEEHLKDRSDWDDIKKRETARKIAIACLKYGMLSQENRKQVVFNMDKWLKLEGDTGGYLLYTLTRIKSIFRKAQQKGILENSAITKLASDSEVILTSELEKSLIRKVLVFNDMIEAVMRDATPSHIANYLQELCKTFSRFYSACPVISENDPVRFTRLLIIQCVSKTLEKGLSLLGIEHIEEM